LFTGSSIHTIIRYFAQLVAEDVEEETDTTGEDLTEPAEDGCNPTGLADILEQGAVGQDDTREPNVLAAQMSTPALPSSGDFPEIADLRHRTEEDDENADTWELDDGYGAWDETFEGDDLDTALAGEPDSVSTGSSTLSGKTASVASKRSFGEVEVEESESPAEQSSQSQFIIRGISTNTHNVIYRPQKNTNAVILPFALFSYLGPPILCINTQLSHTACHVRITHGFIPPDIGASGRAFQVVIIKG
jgi:hypothetical protein